MLPRLSFVLLISVSVAALNTAARAGESFLLDSEPTAKARALGAANMLSAAPMSSDSSLAVPASQGLGSQASASPGAASQGVGLRLTTGGADGSGPDESALRYYASTNQRARVNIEIDRLKRLYPAWEAPQNLYDAAAPGGEDEGGLWDLFSSDRIDDLKAAIDRRMREEAGWQPSADLVQKIQRKTQRMKILALYREGKSKDILDLVKSDAFSSDESDVEVMWLVAETYAKSKQVPEAQGLFKTVLNTSTESSQRIATIQKAMAVLRMSDVEPLIALGRAGPDGRNEFSAILIDIVRARISAYLHDERVDEVDPAELAAFEDYARLEKDPNQPALVAWYCYKVKDYRSSFDWFKTALERGGDAMIAHGLAHSLRELGMRRETEEVAYAWREPLVNNMIVFLDILETDLTKEIPPYIEPERLQRYARTTMETASGEGAQALAWYAYNSCQYDVAWEWFQRATAWFPKEATVYGYALTANRLKKRKELLELANRYDGLFPKVVEILFPDGYYHPPSPCDLPDVAKNRPHPQNMGTFTVPGPSNIDPALARAGADPRDPNVQYGRNGAQTDQPQVPKISRAEFPVQIDPENPQRAASLARPGDRNIQVALPPGANIGLPNEPTRGPYPQVARRVPGVGPMPYERWGFALLPSWNGIETATWPPASAQAAPAGTLWATDADARAQANGGAPAPTSGPSYAPARAPGNGYSSQATTFVPASQTSIQAQQPQRFAPQPMGGAPIPAWGGTRQDLRPVERRSQASGSKLYAALVDLDPVGTIAPEPMGPVATFKPLETSGNTWELRPSLDVPALQAQAETSYHAGEYSVALAHLDARAAQVPETRELAMIRGWSLLHLERREEARRVFASLNIKPKGVGRAALSAIASSAVSKSPTAMPADDMSSLQLRR